MNFDLTEEQRPIRDTFVRFLSLAGAVAMVRNGVISKEAALRDYGLTEAELGQ